LVRGMRGMGGGYRLARPASQISMADIVFAAEELLPVRDDSGDVMRRERDPMWFELTRQIYEFLDDLSLAEFSRPNVLGSDRHFHPAEWVSGTHNCRK
jgi:Rrf2 family transcriptional regulator, iron-sulfur cluster assembly transcription factor